MNPLMIRPTLLGLTGALIIAVRWFQLRRSVPSWTLAPAVLCVAYVFFRAWLFGRQSAGSWYTFDLYTLYADLSFGFNPSLWCNRWVERSGFVSDGQRDLRELDPGDCGHLCVLARTPRAAGPRSRRNAAGWNRWHPGVPPAPCLWAGLSSRIA